MSAASLADPCVALPLLAPLPTSARLRPLERLPEGPDAWVDRLLGWRKRRPCHGRLLQEQAQQCWRLCDEAAGLDESALSQALACARESMRRDPVAAKGQLLQALALIGQAAERVKGMRPYPVQFMGALALHQGWLAEMATGEGKTLTVALAGVLAGWSGRPCHVLTSNDYLAHRDAQTMSALFARCGVSLATVNTEVPAQERPRCYAADVVYVTPKELLADHLRDELAADGGQDAEQLAFLRWLGEDAVGVDSRLLVRGLHTAIVDEADSVLIDEAVTPLILATSRPARGLDEAVVLMAALARELEAGTDYEVIARTRSIRLGAGARRALEAVAADLPPVWRVPARREELLRQALHVHSFFRPGHQYLVDEGEIVLLDEFTGRMTPGRTLTAGLHQAVEAREGVEITDPNESQSQMSFQAFFRGFTRLSGCSGTVWEAAPELWQVFRLGVVRIPTHRPRQTRMLPPRLWLTVESKWQGIAQEVLAVRQAGRAVLVGVRSVESSEALARVLRAHGVEPAVLNAVHHAEEAEIVARAGLPGCVTIATNMAGRGTDIGLHPQVEAQGGLHVVIAEANDSPRIDRQLAGRCGRQGDPGSVSLHLSLEDTLALRYLSATARRWFARLHQTWPAQAAALAARAFARAQQRSERDAFAQRLAVLRADDWMASALPFAKRGPA